MTIPPSSFRGRHADIAARLVVRARDGDVRAEAALQAWIGDEPERCAQVASLQRSWDALEASRDRPAMERWRAQARRSLDKAAARARPAAPEIFAASRSRTAAAALVAMALLALLGGVWLFDASPARDFAITAPADRIRTERLPDGSVVTLDRGAKLTVSFDKATRKVLLEGQGSFAVAHETVNARPFLVRTADREIRATGTRFNVRQETASLEVSLLEGGVVVSTLSEEPAWFGLRRELVAKPLTRLSPGQRFVEREYRAPFVTAFNPADALAWERGKIVLDAETLGRAADIISGYSPVKIIITDERLADRRVSGAFDIGNVAGFAETVGLLYPDTAITKYPATIVIGNRR